MLTRTEERVSRQLATLTPSDFLERWESLPSKADRDQVLRLRFRFDLLGFAKWCWPGIFDLRWNEFHRYALDEPDPPWTDRDDDTFRVLAAPRGVAKTTTGKVRAIH